MLHSKFWTPPKALEPVTGMTRTYPGGWEALVGAGGEGSHVRKKMGRD